MAVKGTSQYSADTSQACQDHPELCLNQNVGPNTAGEVGISNGKFCSVPGSVVPATGAVGSITSSTVTYDPASKSVRVQGTMPAGYQRGVSLVVSFEVDRGARALSNPALTLTRSFVRQVGMSGVGLFNIDPAIPPTVPGLDTCRFTLLSPTPITYTGGAAIIQFLMGSVGIDSTAVPLVRTPVLSLAFRYFFSSDFHGDWAAV